MVRECRSMELHKLYSPSDTVKSDQIKEDEMGVESSKLRSGDKCLNMRLRKHELRETRSVMLTSILTKRLQELVSVRRRAL